MMRKPTPSVLSLLVLAVISAVAVGGWFGVVAPKQSQANDLNVQVAAVQAQLDLARLQAHGRQKPGAATTTVTLAALRETMPDSLEMPTILRQLSAVGRLTGVDIDSVTPQVGTVASGYVSVPLTVVVQGPYAAVQRFLLRLRSSGATATRVHATGHLFALDSISVAPGGTGTQVIVTLGVETFVYSGAIEGAN